MQETATAVTVGEGDGGVVFFVMPPQPVKHTVPTVNRLSKVLHFIVLALTQSLECLVLMGRF